jgi:hypothetical protein
MSANDLTKRHAKEIKGVLNCFDRLVLFGTYKAIGWPGAMGNHLQERGVRLVEYEKEYANALRLEVAGRVKAVAAEEGLSVIQVNARQRKEALVEALVEKRGRKEGIVCILGAMERCRCYKVSKNAASGFLQLQWSPGKCQHYYIYFIDEQFGLGYLRIPTWAPFRLQAYCNGHDWLERRLKSAGIGYRKADNCFTHLADFEAAQALVAKFDPNELHTMLDQLAVRFVAVHERFGASLYWSIYQAEWATDIVFKNDRVLPELYTQIVRTAAVEVGCTDIYRFLGKRQTSRSAAEVSSRYQTLVQGTRIKHTLGSTSLKMYDKAGRVLRIECSTSDISSFTHYRQVEPRQSRDRQAPAGSPAAHYKHAPMRKTLYSLPALAEAMQACNRRYLDLISQWPDRTGERHVLHTVTSPVRDEKDRSHRGVNFFHHDDLCFLQALLRGEHQIGGLRNRSLRAHLPGWTPDKVGRTLRRFRLLGLLKTVAGTRKYYLTKLAMNLLIVGLQLSERIILPSLSS